MTILDRRLTVPRLAPDPATCIQCRTPLAAGARFCAQCGTLAPQAPAHGPTDRRQLAILFYDMVGSSLLAAAMDPEDFADILGAFHRHVGEVIAAHEGHTARYLGDGGMIYFGYPQASETDAERAVGAGLEIIASLPALSCAVGRPIHARVGIAVGVALTGDVLGMGPDVAGAAPNLAARLQGLAEQDTLLIDDALYRLVRPLFDCRALGAQAVHGWADPVALWQVLGRATYESRFEARTRERRSPLIGRDAEAASLRALWARACGGAGRAVLLRGDAGIGKSRLIAQLLEDTEPTPHRRYRLHCSPHQQGAPLYPCVELLERLCGFAPDDDPPRRQIKLATRLAGAPPDDVALIGHLLMLPMTGGHTALAQMSPARRLERTLTALLDGLARAAAGQPLLVVLEDAHWADPPTLDLVARMAGRIGAGPMLLVVSARPDFDPGWTRGHAAQVMTLEPLSAAGSAALARHAVASVSETLPDSALAAIVARCDGNPLFIEEVARGVVEATEIATRTVPASLQASLLGRLDHLGPARETARVASVMGREFDRELLAAVAEVGEAELDLAIERLLDSGLVQQDADTGKLRFKHALIQDAAYDSITRVRRRDLHARAANATATLRPAYAAAQPQLLAYHYTEAGDAANATQWWLRAARQSMQRSAAAEAVAQMERALRLAPGLPRGPARTEAELEMQVLLSKALAATLGQSSTRTGGALARARLLCNAAPDTPHFLTVLFGQWTHAFMQGALHSAVAQSAEIGKLAAERGDPAWIVVGLYTSGYTQFAMGQFQVARENLEAAIALFDPAHPERYTGVIVGNPRVLMRLYLSWALTFLGRTDEARALVGLALAEARALGPVWTLIHALFQCGTFAMEMGEHESAMAFWQEARPIAREAGIPLWEGAVAMQMGWATGLCGDPQAGLALMAEGMALYTGTESQLYLPAFARQEAELHLLAGDAGRAAERLSGAYAEARDRDELWDAASMHMLEGRIAAAMGQPETAARAFRTAIATARAQGAELLAARARDLLDQLARGPSGAPVPAPAPAIAQG